MRTLTFLLVTHFVRHAMSFCTFAFYTRPLRAYTVKSVFNSYRGHAGVATSLPSNELVVNTQISASCQVAKIQRSGVRKGTNQPIQSAAWWAVDSSLLLVLVYGTTYTSSTRRWSLLSLVCYWKHISSDHGAQPPPTSSSFRGISDCFSVIWNLTVYDVVWP